jgi:hypothetical protein
LQPAVASVIKGERTARIAIAPSALTIIEKEARIMADHEDEPAAAPGQAEVKVRFPEAEIGFVPGDQSGIVNGRR